MGDYGKVQTTAVSTCSLREPVWYVYVLVTHTKANTAVQQALQNDPDSAHSHFLAYKVAVMEGALEKGE